MLQCQARLKNGGSRGAPNRGIVNIANRDWYHVTNIFVYLLVFAQGHRGTYMANDTLIVTLEQNRPPRISTTALKEPAWKCPICAVERLDMGCGMGVSLPCAHIGTVKRNVVKGQEDDFLSEKRELNCCPLGMQWRRMLILV